MIHLEPHVHKSQFSRIFIYPHLQWIQFALSKTQRIAIGWDTCEWYWGGEYINSRDVVAMSGQLRTVPSTKFQDIKNNVGDGCPNPHIELYRMWGRRISRSTCI